LIENQTDHKREIGNFHYSNARLYSEIAKLYKGISKFDDPHLEACMFVVNQEHAFEVVFK
jgi:hypothetical protein